MEIGKNLEIKKLKAERDLFKQISEHTIDQWKHCNTIWNESIKRKGEVINRLQAEDVDEWIIEMVRAI